MRERNELLTKIVTGGADAIAYSEHIEEDGAAVFRHACHLGLEGIVSKRLDGPYRSGPSKVWLKSKSTLREADRPKAKTRTGKPKNCEISRKRNA